MTSWIVIRKATDEDHTAIERAACRFAIRHSIKMDYTGSWVHSVEDYIDYKSYRGQAYYFDDGKYLGMLWKRCMNRALRTSDADGISWDTVGKIER